jgi:SM-20-related protein
MIELDLLRATPLATDPFDHVIVPGFVAQSARQALATDFPQIERPGSFPLSELRYGPAFGALIDGLQGPDMAAAMAEKFSLALGEHPTLVTVRGRTQAKDGRIHTDSSSKLLTVLLYLNDSWDSPDGRLRLLRTAESLEDPAVEVPPDAGTLLAFRNGPVSWHGHTSFAGQRRAIQLNWVTDQAVVRREQFRHTVSARIKRLNPFA